MNKIIALLLFIACLFVTGCKRICVLYECTTTIVMENKSNHTIEIKDNNQNNKYIFIKNPINCILQPGDKYSDNLYGEMCTYQPMDFTGYSCITIFDNEIEIDHSTLSEHSLCRQDSYSFRISGRHDTETTYTYVFTDEDYERAVAANADNEK